jgi:TetR/AcrR family transcriptional repressor of nem operon
MTTPASSDPPPRKRDARSRLLDAARDAFRRDGYAATSVDDLCRAAGVTKGAFFHHFRSKEDLAHAAVAQWGETTGALFSAAPCATLDDPVARVFGYLAFRRALAQGEPAAISCLLGALAQEASAAMPALRDDLWRVLDGHAETVAADLAAAKAARAPHAEWNPKDVALFIQSVLQGAFVLAKAKGDSAVVADMIGHLERYLAGLLSLPVPPSNSKETTHGDAYV